MNIAEQLLSVIAPKRCLGCDNICGQSICSDCTAQIPRVKSACIGCMKLTLDFRVCKSCRTGLPLYKVYFYGLYDDLLKDLVMDYKLGHYRDSARQVARLMAQGLDLEDYILCPVPTTSKHIRMRSFDHISLIAKEIAIINNLSIFDKIYPLKQLQQTGANLQTRKKQLINNFYIQQRSGLQLKGKNILIVDDIFTTGSTLREMQRVLSLFGPKHVSAIIFARGIPS